MICHGLTASVLVLAAAVFVGRRSPPPPIVAAPVAAEGGSVEARLRNDNARLERLTAEVEALRGLIGKTGGGL